MPHSEHTGFTLWVYRWFIWARLYDWLNWRSDPAIVMSFPWDGGCGWSVRGLTPPHRGESLSGGGGVKFDDSGNRSSSSDMVDSLDIGLGGGALAFIENAAIAKPPASDFGAILLFWAFRLQRLAAIIAMTLARNSRARLLCDESIFASRKQERIYVTI